MNFFIQAEIGVAYGSPGGSWGTIFVEIPAVAEEQIEAFAIKEAMKKLSNTSSAAGPVAGLWLHNWESIERD